MKKQILAMLLLLLPLGMTAQNWDYIRTSGEYYYGVGHGQTEVEASEQAMADLVSMIPCRSDRNTTRRRMVTRATSSCWSI